MAHIAGINTQKNAKGIITKVTVDLKKHPEVKSNLVELGLLPKTAEELEREEFYKEFNDPANLTGDELFSRVFKHIDSLVWEK